MAEQRIILANGSRLLREMLNRILIKTENLDPVDRNLPEWVDTYMVDHPQVRFMAVAADGSWVKTKWIESHEEELDNLSLKDLIHILGGIREPVQ